MNRERFNWGLILFFFGGILLLRNFGYIDFYWKSFFKMWPVLIILFGVNLLLPKKGIGPAVSILLTIAALIFLGYQGMKNPRDSFRWEDIGRKRSVTYRTDELKSIQSTTSYDVLMDSSMQTGVLKISGGATEFSIEGVSSNYLIQAKFDHSSKINFQNNHQQTDSLVKVDFKIRGNQSIDLDNSSNEVGIRLNQKVPWTIELTSGAGTADFDLKDLKIRHLTFKGGASTFAATLGMPMENSTILVESGVADVEIEIPKSAACRIVVRTGMTSRNFDGFEKQSDGSYITPGYAQATHKFDIEMKGGLSSFTVKRYDD